MIRLLGTLVTVGALVYSGVKLLREIEKETSKESDTNKSVDKTKLMKEATEIQKEIARLHEIYMTTQKLTKTGNLSELDITIEGVPLIDKLKEQEQKLNEIVKKLRN